MSKIISGYTIIFMAAFLYGTPPSHGKVHTYYPVCTDVSHEIQKEWQAGRLDTDDANAIIERCLTLESQGAFK